MRLIQEGPLDARLALIAEAPGKNEDETGRPFAGASGDELNRYLATINVPRSSCFISNVVHKRPPANDFETFLKPKPSLDYLMGVLQLKKDMETIRPNLIVAMGAQALRALTGKLQITKWRGSILPCTLVPGLKVLGTYHPAFVFKDNWEHRYIIEFDFARAKKEMQFSDIRRPVRNILINPSDDEMLAMAQEMAAAEWLSIDIETDRNLKIKCVGFSDRPDRALVIPLDTHTRRNTVAWLCSCPAKKILQNGFNFDQFILEDEGISITNYGWDNMIATHTIFLECAGSDEETAALAGKKRPKQPAFRKGLAWQTSIWTDEPYYKDDGKAWDAEGKQDLDQLYIYNGRDACVQRELRDAQAKDIEEMGSWDTFQHEIAQIPVVHAMSRRGVLIDREEHARLRDKYVAEILRLQAFLDGSAGRAINVKSNPEMKWLLFDKLGLPIRKRSDKTGDPSADKDVITELAMKNPHPLLMTVLEIRERRDIIERYLDVKYDADGRMRSVFDITGTRTGRLSSRASIYGTGTNLQNIPEDIRQMFVASPGHVLFVVDYSQAEARVVAWLARCQALMELFADPSRDVHRENAARFSSIALSAVTDAQRYVAKRTVHASNYGMEFFRFWQVVNGDGRDTGIYISLHEAKRAQEMYFMLYPEIKNNYWRDVRDELYRSRTLVTPFNRKRMFFGRYSEKFLNEAYSFIPQGTIGEMTTRAMVNVHYKVPTAKLLINGHDSLIGECEERHLPDVVSAVQKQMITSLTIHGRELIVPTDVKVGLNWGPRKEDKKTGEVDNPNGLVKLSMWQGRKVA